MWTRNTATGGGANDSGFTQLIGTGVNIEMAAGLQGPIGTRGFALPSGCFCRLISDYPASQISLDSTFPLASQIKPVLLRLASMRGLLVSLRKGDWRIDGNGLLPYKCFYRRQTGSKFLQPPCNLLLLP